MTNTWLRLWHDMPTDPKFRVIAKRAGRPLSEVVSVFVLMLTNASANATERGELSNWSDEDAGAALDIEAEHITAIREAMQGKILSGEKLSGWEKRQPKRDDGSAERAKEWRERKRTQANAEKLPDKTREDKDSETEQSRADSEKTMLVADAPKPNMRKGTRLASDWALPEDWRQWARVTFPQSTDQIVTDLADQFRDYWISVPGQKGVKLDWEATWRNRCREKLSTAPIRPHAQPPPNAAIARTAAMRALLNIGGSA